MSTYMHTGANTGTTGRHAIPRRLDPRRTARIAGIRVRPVTRERAGNVAGIGGGLCAIVGFMDFDNDPTVWYPTMVRVMDAIFTAIFV